MEARSFFCMLARSASLFFPSGGSPSHLLLTFGTFSGSFLDEMPGIPTAVVLPPFCEATFFCWSANSSHAEVEGSFNVKNPSILPLFFFFTGSACSLALFSELLVAA